MSCRSYIFIIILSPVLFGNCIAGEENLYSRWENSFPDNDDFFMVGVWMQDSKDAVLFKELGINAYIGMNPLPDEKDIENLEKAKMYLFSGQNRETLKLSRRHEDIIAGWMHVDQPDNAGMEREFVGDLVPIEPYYILDRYEKMQGYDDTRPIYLSLGQGVVDEKWAKRGWRKGHLEDYREYIKGCDIVSFAFFPSCQKDDEQKERYDLVGEGVERLRRWAGQDTIVWAMIECVDFGEYKTDFTPELVRSQAWMSVIHGAMGVVFVPGDYGSRKVFLFRQENKQYRDMVRRISSELAEMAEILNQPTLSAENDWLVVKCEDPDGKIKAMHKRYKGTSYIFAIEMGGRQSRVEFDLAGFRGDYLAEGLFGSRNEVIDNGEFDVWFAPWQVRIYKIKTPIKEDFYKPVNIGLGGVKIRRN